MNVSRLLILGLGPLPFESTNRFYAPGARTWQIAKPLLDDGHTIHLLGQRLPFTYPSDTPEQTIHRDGLLTYISVDAATYLGPGYVERAYREFAPDAVIYPHGSASFFSTLLESEVPVWIDMNGHLMTEAQAKTAVYQDDSYLEHFLQKELDVLFRGDIFSTVSDAQTFALIGELGLAGRLNSMTNGRYLVHTVPVGVDNRDYEHERTVLRGVDVSDDDFVVLWSGGFNTWTDIDTIFGGLEYAFARDSSVRFAATGGQIDGHDELTYPRFVEMINASPNRERYVLKGWLPKDEVPNYYLEADVGLNCEKEIYEVRFGSKQRILDWSRAALPVLSTRLTELSLALEREQVGFVFPCGSAEALGKAILEASERRRELPAMGERFRQRFREIFGYAKTLGEFRKWAAAPTFAPDRRRPQPFAIEALVRSVQAQQDAEEPAVEPEVAVGSDVAGQPDVEAEVEVEVEAEPEAEPESEVEVEVEVEAEVKPTDPPLPEPPREEESRGRWLVRVARHSYNEGGIGLVLKRTFDRLAGRN